MLDALLITRMQDETTEILHRIDDEMDITMGADELMLLATAQHKANFDLWHEEDKARVPEVPDHEIVRVKRAIDTLNQRRNDLVEKMDVLLIDHLEQNPATQPKSVADFAGRFDLLCARGCGDDGAGAECAGLAGGKGQSGGQPLF